MAFNIREGIWGLEHLRLRLCRKVFKRPAEHYLPRYESQSIKFATVKLADGSDKCCDRCGFLLVLATLENGWQVEMCSALPFLRLDSPAFSQWMTNLSSYDCQQHQYQPILHD